MEEKIKVAVVQAAPVLFDRAGCVEKACQLAVEAGNQGARLVLLPEAFIPGYPRGLDFGVVVGSRSPEGRHLWARYHAQSMDVPGSDTLTLGKAARKAKIYLAIGVIEREGGTLYCTILYFSPEGDLVGKHRKLKPTAAERLIWGEGDGSTLTVLKTDLGKIGGLICWENYMPLARAALYAKGVEIYLAPTADARDTWQATLRHIALEGRCFVLGCNQYVTRSMYPEPFVPKAGAGDFSCRGGSAVVSPLGELLAGPLYDEEGILYADLHMDQLVQARFDFDVVGHYARPDVFRLLVNEKPNSSSKWTG